MSDNFLRISDKNVPIQLNRNVPIDELGHNTSYGKRISAKRLEEIAIEKYTKCGLGINFSDVTTEFACSKPKAQRKLKLCSQQRADKRAKTNKPVLFRASKRTHPQQYFPSCLRAKIIEDLKKRENVPIKPTGVNLFSSASYSVAPLSNAFEHQKAQSFLEVLAKLPFAPLYMHKIQLMLSIDKEYYAALKQDPRPKNKAKLYEENIGKRRVRYTFSPNGTVQVSVVSSDNPFRLETDEDVSMLFSFFGQVRDRLLYQVSDVRERMVPNILEWRLKGCDINKDIEINDIAQSTLPDIQLRYADRVFRLYVKSFDDKSFFRIEESLAPDLSLVEALDNLRHPSRSIEAKLDGITKLLKQSIAKQGA